MISAGNDIDSPEGLLNILREMRFSPGQSIGVEEPNMRELWGNK